VTPAKPARIHLVVARKGVVTIYGLRTRSRFGPRHTLDFESLQPRARERA